MQRLQTWFKPHLTISDNAETFACDFWRSKAEKKMQLLSLGSKLIFYWAADSWKWILFSNKCTLTQLPILEKNKYILKNMQKKCLDNKHTHFLKWSALFHRQLEFRNFSIIIINIVLADLCLYHVKPPLLARISSCSHA